MLFWFEIVLTLIFILIPAIAVSVYIFKRTVAPDAYANLSYVKKLKLKMSLSIAVPVTLAWLVLVLAYGAAGYLGLIVVLVVPIFVLLRILLRMRSAKLPYSVSVEKAPKLHNLVSEVSEKVGVEKNIEIGLVGGFTAFTYGWLKPKVALGIPLFDHLTVSELKSVVAHELGHVRNKDYAFGTFFSLVNESVETAFDWGKRLLGFSVKIVYSLVVGLTSGFVGETIATIIGWICDIFAKIFMAIVTIWLWLWKGFLKLITLLFERQREFMADLHTTHFEQENKPINFKRALGKITLLNTAENEFDKETLEKRAKAVQEGKLSASKLYQQSHLYQLYNWMKRAGFSPTDKMIDTQIIQEKPSIIERLSSWGHTHPIVGDRIRNLESLMANNPLHEKSDLTRDEAKAKELIQDIYDDAVETLYGAEDTV